jgi:hypothetical protein
LRLPADRAGQARCPKCGTTFDWTPPVSTALGRQDLSSLVERKVEGEQRLGIRLEALYAYREREWIYVNGEVHALRSGAIDKSVDLVINLYDEKSRLIGSMSAYVDRDEFTGFDSFSKLENLNNDASAVARILIFAKAA